MNRIKILTISSLVILNGIKNSLSISTVKLPCKYEDVNWIFDNIEQKGYKCNLNGKFEIKDRETAIDGIIRKDSNGYPQPDDYVSPSHLYATGSYIKYIPKQLDNFFGFLRILAIVNSELVEIKQEDLKNFTRLASLNLNQNRLEVLEKDLFKYNPKLQGISLYANWIKFIYEHVFDDLKDLKVVILGENNCVTENAVTRTELISLKKKFKNNCQRFDELKNVEKIKKTGTERGKYFWVLVGCGVIVGVFVVCAVARIVYGIFRKV